jgi:DNA-binding NarL/FixJ family response regulator
MVSYPEANTYGSILASAAVVAQGKSNQQIAKELFVSLKTVRNHVSNIFLKLQVADRAQAVIRAREAGLGHERT